MGIHGWRRKEPPTVIVHSNDLNARTHGERERGKEEWVLGVPTTREPKPLSIRADFHLLAHLLARSLACTHARTHATESGSTICDWTEKVGKCWEFGTGEQRSEADVMNHNTRPGSQQTSQITTNQPTSQPSTCPKRCRNHGERRGALRT